MMKLVRKVNEWVGVDGMLHIVYSAVLTTLLQLVLPLGWAVFVALWVGILKEVVYDKVQGKGVAEIKDMLCNCIGIVIVVMNHL